MVCERPRLTRRGTKVDLLPNSRRSCIAIAHRTAFLPYCPVVEVSRPSSRCAGPSWPRRHGRNGQLGNCRIDAYEREDEGWKCLYEASTWFFVCQELLYPPSIPPLQFNRAFNTLTLLPISQRRQLQILRRFGRQFRRLSLSHRQASSGTAQGSIVDGPNLSGDEIRPVHLLVRLAKLVPCTQTSLYSPNAPASILQIKKRVLGRRPYLHSADKFTCCAAHGRRIFARAERDTASHSEPIQQICVFCTLLYLLLSTALS
jgi:hypothetical protein